MRIAFFVQYCHPVGTYFRWHNLAIALKQQGHEIDIYAGDHNWESKIRQEVKDGIDYYIIPALATARFFYNPNDPFAALRKLFYLPKKQYEVYHLFQPFLNSFIPWIFLKRKYSEAIFLFDWDDLWVNGLIQKPIGLRNRIFAKITEYLEKTIPFKSDGITVCSNFLKERLPQNSYIKVLGNGFWPTAISSKSEMRKKWGFNDTIFYIAYIGKTAAELDWIVDAFKENELEKVKLVIVGPPKSLIDQLNIDTNKVLYLGEVNPSEAKEIATSVDLGLIPLENSNFNKSRFPIKFFDFLTVNTPIYLSDVGEIALIGKKMTNVFVGSNNKKDWVKNMPQAIEAFKANGSKTADKIIENFTWSNLAQELTIFYKQVKDNS